MKQNRELTELKNIGKKIAGRLNEVGIFSEDRVAKSWSGWRTQNDKRKVPYRNPCLSAIIFIRLRAHCPISIGMISVRKGSGNLKKKSANQSLKWD